MAIATGAFLAFVTWVVLIAALLAIGIGPAIFMTRQWSLTSLRMGLWIGLLIATLATLVLNLFVPLRSASAAIGLLLVILGGVLLSTVLIRHRHALGDRLQWHRTTAAVAVIAIAIIGMGYMAFAALGPVTNYDSGMYHIGAAKYAGDYATIPGLATLFGPFGYANALIPMGAVLGNGPWDGTGYRLINGLLMALMATDLGVRVLQRRWSVGTWILLVGVFGTWMQFIALSDYWVISPTSDSAVLILTVVSVAYAADALHRRPLGQPAAATAILLAILTAALRPTMAIFALLTVAVALFVMGRTHGGLRRTQPRIGLVVLIAGLAVVGAQAVRDYRLSGWLQYPLSIRPFSVDWRAADPWELRTATLGAARNPDDLWTAAESWNWVGIWFVRLWGQWETYFLIAVLATAIGATLLARRAARREGITLRLSWAMVLTMAPSAGAVLAWFLASPPSYRFIWGPLFTLGFIPLGWALHAWQRADRRSWRPVRIITAAGVGVLSLVIAYSAIARLAVDTMTAPRIWSLGPIDLSYVITPIPLPPIERMTLPSGLEVLYPTESDQCWDHYPLCTLPSTHPMALRGESLQDGFRLQSK